MTDYKAIAEADALEFMYAPMVGNPAKKCFLDSAHLIREQANTITELLAERDLFKAALKGKACECLALWPEDNQDCKECAPNEPSAWCRYCRNTSTEQTND